MKSLFLMMLLRFLAMNVLLFPLVAYSDTEPKNFNLGIGYYSLEIYDEAYSYEGDRLNGASLSAAYMLSNKVALRGTYYLLKRGNFADTDASGLEALAYYGNGLAMRGLKWYVGGGYFSEEWDIATESNSFSGLQLGGGFGYNWERYSFDMFLHFRDTSDYDKQLAVPGGEINTAGVLSLMLSSRF
jgi:hypothetical protein